jgi:hypothetical protein
MSGVKRGSALKSTPAKSSLLILACLGAALANLLVLPATAQTASGEPPLHADGAIPDTPETLRAIPRTPTYRAFLPDRVDLSRYFPAPGDQGPQGSCVAWAVGYAARAYYAERAENRDVNDARNIPSPAYIYDVIKPAGSCGTGSKISDALELLKTGAVSLADFPYSPRFCLRPPEDVRARATDFRIEKWELVSKYDLDQIKAELYNKNPVIISLHDSVSFNRLKAGQIYLHPGRYLGWHALTVVGYDERRQAFKVINSWGRHWADRGFGWIGYSILPEEVSAAYVMRVKGRQKPPEPPQPPKPAPLSIVLPHLDCAKVSVEERGGKRAVVGFVGHDKGLAAIKKAAPDAEIDVQLRPWPQCEALLTLDKSLSQPDAPRVSIEAGADKTLNDGDHLVFQIETPPYPSYLNVTYFQADGSAVNLMQPGASSFIAYPPRSKIVLGGPSSSRRFRVSAPFGREMLVVLAARSPVFPKARPAKETQREFLTALRRAFLYKSDSAAPDRDIVAGYDAIVTKGGIVTEKRP